MKLPAFQFYPADWRKDPGVQALSFHDRGIWFEILCLMHESSERGKLTLRGQPMPEDALARLLGLDKQNLTKALTTLLDYGVASRCPDSGALVCRRMMRDEDIREKRREAGKLGGNPTLTGNLIKQKPTTEVKQKSTPSSSSSASSSTAVASKQEVRAGGALMDLVPKVNSLRPEWQKMHHLSGSEMHALQSCAHSLECLDDASWNLMRDYLAYTPRGAEKLYQVRSREKFLQTPVDTLTAATEWQKTQGGAPKSTGKKW